MKVSSQFKVKMCPDSEQLQKIRFFLEENLGKILFTIGIIFLSIGVLSWSVFGSSISILGFFLGVTLTGIGLLVKIEAVTSGSSRKKKLGSFLAATSMFFFAGACVAAIFTEIERIYPVIPLEFHTFVPPELNPYEPSWETVQPFSWLFVPLFSIGLCFLVFGLILKKR